jgi:hypothetical protein
VTDGTRVNSLFFALALWSLVVAANGFVVALTESGAGRVVGVMTGVASLVLGVAGVSGDRADWIRRVRGFLLRGAQSNTFPFAMVGCILTATIACASGYASIFQAVASCNGADRVVLSDWLGIRREFSCASDLAQVTVWLPILRKPTGRCLVDGNEFEFEASGKIVCRTPSEAQERCEAAFKDACSEGIEKLSCERFAAVTTGVVNSPKLASCKLKRAYLQHLQAELEVIEPMCKLEDLRQALAAAPPRNRLCRDGAWRFQQEVLRAKSDAISSPLNPDAGSTF